MPNWQPNWENVVWNWGAANEAVAALNRAAGALENSVHERSGFAASAQQEWRGFYRSEFDQELNRLKQNAQNLASEYRNLAHRIAAASEAARAEQSRRERDRERWRQEKRDEERREQEERERRERERKRN
jgi:uncharacterized protein YukE